MAIVPINVDRNITRKDIAALPDGVLRVTKLFYTYQGEGPFTGTPAWFLRLAGCDIGAKLDNDFGISKGLPGLAENLFKFLANLAAAPI